MYREIPSDLFHILWSTYWDHFLMQEIASLLSFFFKLKIFDFPILYFVLNFWTVMIINYLETCNKLNHYETRKPSKMLKIGNCKGLFFFWCKTSWVSLNSLNSHYSLTVMCSFLYTCCSISCVIIMVSRAINYRHRTDCWKV